MTSQAGFDHSVISTCQKFHFKNRAIL